ncbi:MAG TPA: hypothetical protein VL996_07385 [Methylocella sp.]|nr:hypothetical protein [Methylocella sp.]
MLNDPSENEALPITLEQFSLALAAHALLTAFQGELHKFTSPEFGESIASFIQRFALGEKIDRPQPHSDGDVDHL